MGRRLAVGVSIPLFLALLAAGCANTPRSDAESPTRPTVATAGWESSTAEIPVAAPAKTSPLTARSPDEMEELRTANEDMIEQVRELREKVRELSEEPAAAEASAPASAPAAASTAAPAAPAAPAVDAGAVRRALLSAGATELTVATNRVGEVVVTLPGSMSFGAGKADLSPEARTTLGRLAAVLKRDLPQVRLRVEGHTDSDPIRKSSWASNEALSAARAGAVARVLATSGGVAANRIESTGFGATRPVASNATREGKALNRRVEIVIVP